MQCHAEEESRNFTSSLEQASRGVLGLSTRIVEGLCFAGMAGQAKKRQPDSLCTLCAAFVSLDADVYEYEGSRAHRQKVLCPARMYNLESTSSLNSAAAPELSAASDKSVWLEV